MNLYTGSTDAQINRIFVCFILEHLLFRACTQTALSALGRGTHVSTNHPENGTSDTCILIA